jgi:hypothetical protein
MTEHYTVTIDRSVSSREQLFARFTDTIFLGESGIPGWDQFEDLLYLRLAESDILVDLRNEDLTGLPARDCSTYLDVIAQVQAQTSGSYGGSNPASAYLPLRTFKPGLD